jgi:L-ascorbate metabolism protein UlaG (beta-lactamase superfamily)
LAFGGVEALSLSGHLDNWRIAGVSRRSNYADAFAHARKHDGVVHVAHSTHVIALSGLRFLTDPWFYDPAFGALGHAVAPAVAPDEVGAVRAILVSHDHPDHADLRAMDRMDKRATVLVATPDLASRVKRLGFAEVHVLATWQAFDFGPVRVTAVPALHDVHEVGYVLQSDRMSVYFAGDTAIHPELEAIRERCAPRFAILPVDGTRIRGTKLSVMTPTDAASAALRLGVQGVMPSHAEAELVDPLAEYVLVEHVQQAAAQFATEMAQRAAHIQCVVPAPGSFLGLTTG